MLAKGRRPIHIGDPSSQPLLPPSAEDTLLTVFYTSGKTATQPHYAHGDSSHGNKAPPPLNVPSSADGLLTHSAHDSTSQCPSSKYPLQPDNLTPKDPFPVVESAVDNPVACTSGPALARPPHQRAKWDSIERRSLEDCLASLSQFDAHHLGRVSAFDQEGKTAAAATSGVSQWCELTQWDGGAGKVGKVRQLHL